MNFDEFIDYLKARYPEPTIRGKKFEPFAKWFLQNDSVYRNIFKKVWLWDDWPGRWGPDAGIDLIAEDGKGRIWAVQSKNYAEHHIVKSKIDSFISQSTHKDIFGMYLLTTSDNISPHSLRQMNNSGKPARIIGTNEANIDLKDKFFIDHINGTYPANQRRKILDKLRKLEQDKGGDCHRRFRV